MKLHKIFIIGSVILSIIIFGIFYRSNQSQTVLGETKESTYHIAILQPISHPALEEIKQGFVDTLQKDLSFIYDVYNANGDRVLMRSQAEEIVRKKYDLVFTIATGPALIMKEVSEQRQNLVPIVAGAVDNPVGIKLITSMESSQNNVTAVTGIDNFEQQISLLQLLKPAVKNILLVYNPTDAFQQKKQVLEQLFKQKNIQFKALEIMNLNDLIQKPPAVIGDTDTILVLKDNLVVSGIESLINLCNRHHITLYASDLNSGDKGAVLSYGVREYDDGVESAYKALEILKNGKKPTEIPSSANTAFKIKLNTHALQQQGLTVDEKLLFLIKSGQAI